MSPAEKSELGRRVRSLRRLKHVNQQELAKRADVTPGFLSQLEHGNTGASVSTVLRLAIALGVPVSELFEENTAATALTRRQDQPGLGVGAGNERLLLSPVAHPGVEIYWSSLEPGCSSHESAYTHGDSDEFVIGVEGQMTCMVGTKTYAVGPGDTLQLRTSIPHIFRNLTTTHATVITIATPSTQGDQVHFTPSE